MVILEVDWYYYFKLHQNKKMNRREFVEKCTMLGIGFPFLTMMNESCVNDENTKNDFSGKVLIIGAGAAGLTAGYYLHQQNIDFEIIEASSVFGGRVKRTSDFADFPIDLGAEWIHTDAKVLSKIADNPTANETIKTIEYNPTVHYLRDGKLKLDKGAYSENKFKSTTWFGFFEKFIVPAIQDKIQFNQPVNQINYSGDIVAVSTKNGETFTGDKVIVTVPIKILQGGKINFIPALPQEKTKAINNVVMVDGIKIFMEFKEKFYPEMIIVGKKSDYYDKGYKIFYDATFKKDTDKNILGLFTVDKNAQAYIDLSEQQIIDNILAELDNVFEGKATKNYTKHIIQNWSKEEHIQGAYSFHFKGFRGSIMKKIAKPVNNKIYFAGEALSKNNQAQVHGACETSYNAVKKILENG
jgi:monoamine oxidase